MQACRSPTSSFKSFRGKDTWETSFFLGSLESVDAGLVGLRDVGEDHRLLGGLSRGDGGDGGAQDPERHLLLLHHLLLEGVDQDRVCGLDGHQGADDLLLQHLLLLLLLRVVVVHGLPLPPPAGEGVSSPQVDIVVFAEGVHAALLPLAAAAALHHELLVLSGDLLPQGVEGGPGTKRTYG